MKKLKMFALVVAGVTIFVSATVGMTEGSAERVEAAARPEKWAVPMTCAGVPSLLMHRHPSAPTSQLVPNIRNGEPGS